MADRSWLAALAELAGRLIRLAALALVALALALVALVAGLVALAGSLLSRLFAELATLLKNLIPWAQRLAVYIVRGLAVLIGAGGAAWATFVIWQNQGATWTTLLLAATIILIPAAFGWGVELSYGTALAVGLLSLAVAAIICYLPPLSVPLAIGARTVAIIAVRPYLFPPTPEAPNGNQ